MNLVFYHSSDFDGHCSGAIIRKYLDSKGEKYKMCPIDRGDSFPWEDLSKNTTVWMSDYSLDGEELYKIYEKSKDFIWNDHHEEAYESAYKSNPELKEVKGIRNKKYSGCELTWSYCFGNPLPQIVILLGRFDVWDKNNPDLFDNLYEPYQYGMRRFYTDPIDDGNYEAWLESFENNIFKGYNVEDMVKDGNTILQYQRKQYDTMLTFSAFEKEFDGKKALISNTNLKGIQLFLDYIKDYDYCIVFCFDGEQYVFSIYSVSEDVRPFAQARGGNGHEGASGFRLSPEEFKEFIKGVKKVKVGRS